MEGTKQEGWVGRWTGRGKKAEKEKEEQRDNTLDSEENAEVLRREDCKPSCSSRS
jgi:hypothetical protein